MTADLNRLSSEPFVVAPRPAARWWVVPLAAVGVLLLLVVLTAVAFAIRLRLHHTAAVAKVKSEVARLEAAGEPVTTEALYAFHTVPAGTRDITRVWLAVLRSFDERQFNADAAPLPVVGEADVASLSPAAAGSQLGAATMFLQKYDATLQATLAAAREEGECRFPVEFEKGIALLLPHAQKMRSLSRLLVLSLRVQALRGDTEGALESLEAVFAAADTLQNELCLIEHLVRLAIVGQACGEAEWLLSEAQLSDEQLARLQAHLQAIDLQSGLTIGLIGERAMAYHTFHHLSALANEEFGGAGELPFTLGTPDGQLGRPADCLKTLELLGETIAASRAPFPEARTKATQMENRLRALAGTRNPLERMKYMVTLLMLPATSSAFDATARGLARRDALLAAIAAERFRLQTGSFPSQLDDLVPDLLPAVPTDPFDGQPLRLKRQDGALMIYSVGRDGIDDGGQENAQRPGEPDLVVRVQTEKGNAP